MYFSYCKQFRDNTPVCCVAARAVCEGHWCSVAGLAGGAASANGTLTLAGRHLTMGVASMPKEQKVSGLPIRENMLALAGHLHCTEESYLKLGSGA